MIRQPVFTDEHNVQSRLAPVLKHPLTILFEAQGMATSLKHRLLTRGQVKKKASRATCFAYFFVFLTRLSGPGGIARDQFYKTNQTCCCSGGWLFSCFHFFYSNPSLICFLDIRHLPGLVEQRFLWTIEAGQDLEAPIGVSRNPVRFSSCRRCGTEVDIDRTIDVLL